VTKRSSELKRIWNDARTRMAISFRVSALALQLLYLLADAAGFPLRNPTRRDGDLLAVLVLVRSFCRAGLALCAISAKPSAGVAGRAVIALDN